ncbi:DnaJ C-terminal domain-containing protein [Cyanobium sp. NIES-981]|uniref:DnaJ C-terminal domain-containing protein n=1 Tax=Cyanobium sp. NIES-981 TaxID=1851505 RepID=UPI0007DDE493|nr:DnaJ C-terminal domain-containing protein [Cyanobium sp. NIES-981]SBO42200.1 DnaJ2 protein [Cyanobium sp. NIES-981]
MSPVSQPPLAPPDYWAVLGLDPGADPASLKRAFRSQARRYHPDLNGNDPVAEERFKLVNEAYAVLSDPRRRAAWERGDPAGSGGPRDPFATAFPLFEDYLAELFGQRGRHRQDSTNQDSPRQHSSSGHSPSPFDPDPPSGGPVTPSPAPPPPVQASTDLESRVDLTPEQALQGERLELTLADGTVVEVWTPPMAGDGWRLRLEGVAPGGGDHFLHLQVRTEEGLRIDGLRVHFPLELSPAEAALGCQVVVPTLRGPVKLTVPPCSSSGRLLRLRGRGLSWGEQRGDQLVEVKIVLPEQLDDAEMALYNRLLELADEATPRGDGAMAG